MLANLQYLRLLAALLVVLNHAVSLVLRVGRNDIGHSFEIGAAGVDIFFAISGFIMVYITAGKRVTAGAFLRDRIARIAPPYWLVTLVSAVLIVMIPHIFDSPPLTIPHLLASLSFIPWSEASFADSVPLYLPGWTLNYEMMFYLVFALALWLAPGRRTIAAAAMLAGLVAVGQLVQPANMIAEFYTHPIIVEFLFGMLVAQIVLIEAVPPAAVSLLLLVAGAVLLMLATRYAPPWRLAPERCLVWGVPAAMIVAGAVFLEVKGVVRRSAALLLLGDASYAIYLTHFFVVGAVGKVWGALHLSAVFSDVFLFAVAIGLSLGVGLAFHLAFEKPVLRLLKGGRARLALAAG